jgi:hypothetical protein
MKIDFAQKLDGNAFRVKLKRSSRISAQETNPALEFANAFGVLTFCPSLS